jgi:HK97 family phage portal protein
MSLIQRVKAARDVLFRFTVADLDRLMDLQLDGVPTNSGVAVSEQSGMKHATVFACINILSRDMSALPLKLFERLDSGGRAEVKEHQVSAWLRNPNPVQTPQQFRQRQWVSKLAWGNEFAQIRRRNGGIETWPLDPSASRMAVEVTSGGLKQFRHTDENGKQTTLRAAQVLHDYGFSIDGYVGVSPIRWCMETVGRAIAVSEYAGAYFRNPTPKVVFAPEIDFKDSTAREKFRSDWQSNFAGKEGLKTIAVVPPGMGKPEFIRINNDEAQFIETAKFSKEGIAEIYQMPLHRLQALDRATFSNIEHQDLEYTKYTLLPWLVGYEQALAKQFLTREERGRFFFKHNVNALLRGDFKSRQEGYALGINSGHMLRNEARELEDRNPIDGLDTPLVQGAMIPADQAGQMVNQPSE